MVEVNEARSPNVCCFIKKLIDVGETCKAH